MNVLNDRRVLEIERLGSGARGKTGGLEQSAHGAVEEVKHNETSLLTKVHADIIMRFVNRRRYDDKQY